MDNSTHHIRLTMDFHIWTPFKKFTDGEIDELLGLIRTRKLLGHIGNFHTKIEEIGE